MASAPVLRGAGRHLRMPNPVPVWHACQVRNRPHSNLRQPAQEHHQEVIKPDDRTLQTNVLIDVLSGSDRTCPKRVHLEAAMLNGGSVGAGCAPDVRRCRMCANKLKQQARCRSHPASRDTRRAEGRPATDATWPLSIRSMSRSAASAAIA